MSFHFTAFLVLVFCLISIMECKRIPSADHRHSLTDTTKIFDWGLKTQTAKLNTNYKMKCVAKVPISVFWTVDGKVPDGTKFKILPDSNLLIRNISVEDFGREYLCHALIPGNQMVDSIQINLVQSGEEQRNDRGYDGDDIQIDHIIKHPEVISTIVGERKTLSCKVQARPVPDFKWLYSNGTLIQNKTDFIVTTNGNDVSNLTILVRNSDYLDQIYICEAWNNLGKTEQSFLLKLPQKPKEIVFVYPKIIGASKVVLGLNFDRSNNNHSVYVQFKPVDDGSEWEGTGDENILNPEIVEIANLLPNTTYLFRAALQRESVLGDFSLPIQVTTDKDKAFYSRSKQQKQDNIKQTETGRSLFSENFDILNVPHGENDNVVRTISSSSSNTSTSKVVSKIGNKIFITTNSSTVEEVYNDENNNVSDLEK